MAIFVQVFYPNGVENLDEVFINSNFSVTVSMSFWTIKGYTLYFQSLNIHTLHCSNPWRQFQFFFKKRIIPKIVF